MGFLSLKNPIFIFYFLFVREIIQWALNFVVLPYICITDHPLRTETFRFNTLLCLLEVMYFPSGLFH